MGDWSFAGGMRAHPELRVRYEILERLGEGTYGEVYKGKRKVDGLVVALKETRDTQSGSREAEALLVLAGQPHVVKLIEFFFVEGSSLILVLEFLPSDLYQIIQASDRRIREAEVKGWIVQLLRGVASCHQAGILHRDLKPSNLLVAADGTLKVADFGQARIVAASNTGTAGMHITSLQENEVKAGLNLEKESVDAWIEGTLTMKNGMELPARERKGEARDVMIDREEVDKEAVEKAEENGYGQCYCEEGDDTGRSDERNSSGNMLGCRSLNCSMIKRDGLIVARSNHFVEMEKKMEAVTKDEELGRREWVLAEKNMVGPPQEKDSDFFYKLRSFLKRRGRKPHKQNRWGKEKGSVETSQVILEEDGGRPDQYRNEYTTTVLHQSLHDNLSVPGPISDSLMRGNLEMWTDNISIKESDAMKSNVDYLEDMGLRPLIGNESTEEEILLRAIDRRETCTVEKSSKRSTFDLKESVHAYTYEPVVENPFDGTYISQTFGDSGRMIMNSSTHGHVGRDDLGSESKRRKAYELEKGIEETMSTELGGAKCEAWGDGSKENLYPANQGVPADMETDTGLTELEAVRMRILYGKHRRTDSQKGEAPSLHSGDSINSTGHCELPVEPPTLNPNVSPPTDSYLAKSEGVKVDGEETENAVCVLGLERIHNGIEGYIREVECAQEGSGACGPENDAWKDTARFWDGNRQKWEPLNEASDEDRATEDQDNAKWYVGGCGQQMGVNGGFYNDSSYVEDRIPAYYMYGSAGIEDSDQEDDNPSGQTRWFRPPDVRDSYVKGKLEVHEEGSQSENAIGYFGEDIEQSSHERLQEIEVHSQQEETESTCSGESGNKGSELSPCVGTRWYKGPELLYGATKYGKGLDMWAVGCVFAELLNGKPLFPGITDIDQLSRIVRVLGAAKESNWPGVSLLPDFDKISFSDERPLLSFQSLIPQASSSAIKFLEKLLVYDPERRLSAEAALRDIYFVEDPLPAQPQDLKVPSFRRDSSASEEWGEWRDPGSPFSDFEILDSAP